MRIPSAGTPVSTLDLLSGLVGAAEETFGADLAEFAGVDWSCITGSGTVALFLSLQILAERSERREVVLPAYTAPSLVLPIWKAGLRPVLCEVDLKTFNAGPDQMLACTGPDTLAVIPVHMFGLPVDMKALVDGLKGSGTWVLEDAASSMGSAIDGKRTGTFGDVGFTSFNRGKNMATLAGGALFSNDLTLRQALKSAARGVPAASAKKRLATPVLAAGLSAAVRPLGYTLLYPIVSRFKYTALHTDFELKPFSRFQAGLGRRLLRRFRSIITARAERARYLRHEFESIESVTLPQELPGSEVVYNQFPVLFPDKDTRERVHRSVLETGLEATLLYPDPIHRIRELSEGIWDGSGSDPFPNATTLSERLMLYPLHPLVPMKSLERAVETTRRVLQQRSPKG